MSQPPPSPSIAAAGDALLKAVEGRATGKGSRGPYSGGYNDAIASAVRPEAEPPRMIMGAVEILTFFPHMMQWPDALFRLLRSGWTSSDIATAQLYARGGLEKDDHMKRNQALRQQMSTAGNEKLGVNDFTKRGYAQHAELQPFTAAKFNYDTTGWNPPHANTPPLTSKTLIPLPTNLSDVANGVTNWPQGEDRGLFTKVMEWAQANNVLHQYTVRDVMRLANDQANGIGGLPAEARTHEWDQGGLERTRGIVKPWMRGG
ncbi:hypothetical protein CLAFUW4_02457 [Fulvia fulva]|uniref:Uncharacterized protein n=1 Tax=Passalora fulva TaxID=5499 RepID=A0A9Q8LAG5_PASFU|nr:uncharacterized protein CLAFUR5_02447 [Fulvia fulva]KAK4632081.1 hypothetical protein CLAFUR4_02452 [Fulvia fulva]KAK4633268.1 hypothetical protein CLAFUR0_02456 [Fulvia fulva]UJO13896.1 hypothetical protein CLAFUR5_02447 [Fulvia fulva]WPV10829.1 hypothetical protein CLAFUW4_02457 [Fulvia fulva]WPV25720.1 hypothetical protein CLAFUW7_02457 [Fulvia fulva]